MAGIQELYARASEQFGEKVRAIGADQWGNATPCTEWDVRALVNHLVYENLWVAPLLEGRSVAEIGDRFEGDQLGDDPVAAWKASAAPAIAAVRGEGAMMRTVHLSGRDVPGEQYAQELFFDLAIHGWDLARGIGAEDAIDPKFVQVLFDVFAPMEEELKGSGVYGEKVVPPEGADLQTKLLAITGRVA